jgi:hypothetical protein
MNINALTPDEQTLVYLAQTTRFRATLEPALEMGARVYGPFEADKPDPHGRNMVQEAMNELRDAFVYLGMMLLQEIAEYQKKDGGGGGMNLRLMRLTNRMQAIEILWLEMNKELEDGKTLVRVLSDGE